MRYEEFQACINNPDAFQPDASLGIRDLEDTCVVNDLFPIRVEAVAALYPLGQVSPIETEDGTWLGDLLTCKGEAFDVTRFSAHYLAAYLLEIPKDQYAGGGEFACNYLLLNAARVEEYRRDFMTTAAVWGAFSHTTNNAAPPAKPLIRLKARLGISFPTAIHVETAERSVTQPYAFERFLKLYHLLELSSDYIVVQQIRNLNDDLQGIGQILSHYGDKDLVRLNRVVSSCNDIPGVAQCMEEICRDPQWHPQLREIFFEYGKKENPIQDVKTDAFMGMLLAEGYNLQGLRVHKIGGVSSQHEFHDFSLRLACYWIYRIRCSIAHSRIGEYVMRLNDEAFVERFAEILLRRVLATTLRAI